MTKIESIQSKIIGRMQDELTNEQLQRLENLLAIEFVHAACHVRGSLAENPQDLHCLEENRELQSGNTGKV